ncbi:MAG: hypothetical protein GC192_17825 [Bacteroidetes bacterium]|nr:hypothetical protein [Bacteroidota bacterium]
MATKATKEAAPAVAAAVSTTTTAPELQTTLEESVNLPCAREYFYQMALMAWAYCRADRLLFVEESDRYTEEFIDDQVAFITSVKNLPDLSVLQAAATEANEGLAAWRQQVGSLSKRLDNAISYAFKNPATADSERQLAGLTDFGIPSGEPWAQVDSFLTKANNYLTAKISVLVDAMATTASLQTKFTDVTTGFSAAWADFILKEKNVTDGTKATKDGLIAILAELNPMLDDGKLIYEFDATNRKKFTIKDLVREVRGTHPAGLAGYVHNDEGYAMPGVLVAVQNQADKFAITDGKGKYKINLAGGYATFNYTMEGMVPQSVTRNLTPGVTSRQNVVLLPMPVEAEPAMPETVAAPPSTTQELSNALSDLTVHTPSTNGAAV